MYNSRQRIISLLIALLTILSVCTGCSGAQSDSLPEVPDIVSEADIPVSAADISSESEEEEKEEIILEPDQFVRVQGYGLIDENGDEFLMRGVNFVNDALCNPQQMFFAPEESYYAELNSMGVNCIRFSLNYGLFENDDQPFAYKESGFDWVDQNLALAEKYNIRLLLSFVPQGCWKMLGWSQDIWKDESCQERFIALSTEIARRYANEPFILGYGLIGEPVIPIETSVEDSLAMWQDLAQRAIDGIRSVDKNHIVFVERALGCSNDSWQDSGWDWSGYYPHDDFVKVDDSNLVYEFHNYDPEPFTSQAYEDYVTYPMPNYGYNQLRNRLHEYVELREYLDAPMLCGEFGCASKCYEEEYNGLQWLDDFTDICEEFGINFTLYAFRDQWYDEELLYTTYWNENIVNFFREKYGALADPPLDTEITAHTDPALSMPSVDYVFGYYMRASGINCVVMPCYLSEDSGYYYPNEPLLAWVGDDTWQILFDWNDFDGVPDTDGLGQLLLEVISYGDDPANHNVSFSIESVELKTPDGSISLSQHEKDYSMQLVPDEFGQNSNTISIRDFGDDVEGYQDLRQYRMVIRIKMTEYNSFFSLP